MNQTRELINVISAKEKQGFIQYLRNRNKRIDTKNIDLFKAYLDGTEDQIRAKIGSNAFNVLKKRMNDRLQDYLGTSVLFNEVSKEAEIIKSILLSRKLLAYGHIQLGYKVLHKAEKASSSINHYSLLNEIYHTMIENSYKDDSLDQLVLYKKLESNTEHFLQEERLNLVYASIHKAYAESERTGERLNLEVLLKEKFEKYNISNGSGFGLKSLYKIATIADVEGFHYRNYHNVDLFFIDQIQDKQGSSDDVEKNILYHIGLLYTVSNILFRKKEFDQSLHYLQLAQEQMDRFGGKYREVYYSRSVVLKALNLNYSGNFTQAANLLDELLSARKKKLEELASAKLTRVMIYLQQGEFEKARSLIAGMQHSDSWYENHLGMEWTVNKNFIEILLHIELGNLDLAESRMNSFKRRYQSFFSKDKNSQVMKFLQLVKLYHQNPMEATEDSFKQRVYNSLEFKSGREEDIFLISYYAWLKAKMEKRNLYKVTLELLNKD